MTKEEDKVNGSMRNKVKEVKVWDVDDCRHAFPGSVMRAPGVLTFVCGCEYLIGCELLCDTENPAHAWRRSSSGLRGSF